MPALLAHCRVRLESVDDRIHEFFREIGRVCKLLLGVVGRLLHEDRRFQQLALEHVVHVDQLVVIGQLTLEQCVDLGDDLVQQGLLRLLDLATAGVGRWLELVCLARLYDGNPGSLPECRKRRGGASRTYRV